MKENNKQLSNRIHDLFVSYYTKRFSSDLKSFYDIRNDFGDGSYPFVLMMTCGEHSNTHRKSMKWDDIVHFYMFSVAVFFTSMCSQVIGRLYGWFQMENFLRASGWPMLNCGMGGLMHPIVVIEDSMLYPKEDKDRYYDILHVASDYLEADFLDFFSGHAANLNSNAYRQLCDIVIPQEVASEFQTQVSLYEAYIGNPEIWFQGIYVKYPEIHNRPQDINKDISSYLSQFEEDMPLWLWKYKEGMPVSFSDIMAGRVAYYPGSGYDGTLIKVGNRSRAVHSYLYVDYGIGKEDLIKHLAEPNSIYGYHSIGRIEWNENDILPNGQYPLNVHKNPRTPYNGPLKPDEKPYCFTEILERNPDKDEDFGAKRFAVTFLFKDGIDTYFQLFCMEYKKAPWIFLLQDHGLGGNYDKFGKGGSKEGLLDAIIRKNGLRPQFVICADNTRIWDGYKEITELPPINDGKHNPRRLYKKIPRKG